MLKHLKQMQQLVLCTAVNTSAGIAKTCASNASTSADTARYYVFNANNAANYAVSSAKESQDFSVLARNHATEAC